ncbi:hypothetical protein [Thiomonas sp.]
MEPTLQRMVSGNVERTELAGKPPDGLSGLKPGFQFSDADAALIADGRFQRCIPRDIKKPRIERGKPAIF